jgi:16S rRNA G966 N2-methylase RsmD
MGFHQAQFGVTPFVFSMFSYYGSKSKIIDCYPPPKHNKIIEPFAGSARYSLKYWDRDILLVDKYEVIVRVWKYLQSCNKNDILQLPEYNPKEEYSKSLSDEERWLIGFNCNRGSSSPGNVAGSYHDVLSVWRFRKKQIAADLHKIKHWKVIHGCYTEIENEQATWFIDAPYQFGGKYYVESSKNLNFNELSKWCKGRNGHVIVCENTKADWMDFKSMKQIQGSANTDTTEAIWSNIPTNYDNVQQTLF